MAANDDVVKKYLSKDYYKVLGIDDKEKANDSQYLKQVYKNKSREVHPDKHQTEKDKWTETFKLVNEAYTVLSDPEKKALYDQSRADNDKLPCGDYSHFFRKAKSSQERESGYSALHPQEITKDLRAGQSRVYIYIPPDFLEIGSAKKTHCQGRDTAINFEIDFPNGYYVNAKDLSYNEETDNINITIRKFRNISDTFPSINYKLESKTFLLAIQRDNDYQSLPLVIGLIAVSKNHKFAIFSFIENLSEETLIRGLLWDGFKSLPNQFGSAYYADRNGYFDITQNLISSEQHAVLMQQHVSRENAGQKPKFSMKLFKEELVKEHETSLRAKFFGESKFVSDIFNGKQVSLDDIKSYAQTHPFGTVKKVLDKFDTQEQNLTLDFK